MTAMFAPRALPLRPELSSAREHGYSRGHAIERQIPLCEYRRRFRGLANAGSESAPHAGVPADVSVGAANALLYAAHPVASCSRMKRSNNPVQCY